jgi:hypothetical protein
MNKKVLYIPAFALLFLVAVLCGTASATIDQISYPYNNEIINSATIDLNYTSTGSASCYWNYNNGHNYTISCGKEKVRLPKTDGNYTIVVSDNTFSQKSVNVVLDQPDGFVIVFFSIAFIVIVMGLVALMMLALIKAIGLTMGVEELAYNWGAYFGLLAIYVLEMEYLGNITIHTFLNWMMQIGGITNFFIPAILFMVCWFKSNVTGEDSDYKK